MAKITKKTVRTQVVGKATLVEQDIFVNGEYEDTICLVKIGRHQIGGYISINDALAHKEEWYDE